LSFKEIGSPVDNTQFVEEERKITVMREWATPYQIQAGK